MVMSGIAVHTAMLVFGTTRTLQMTFTGAAVYLPWLLPTLILFALWGWLAQRIGRKPTFAIAFVSAFVSTVSHMGRPPSCLERSVGRCRPVAF